MHLHEPIPLTYRPSDYGTVACGESRVIARVAMYGYPGSIELHATRTPHGWRYHFSNPFGWELVPGRRLSSDTLSLAELIALLEGATVAEGHDAYLTTPICGGINLLPGDVSVGQQREHLRAAADFPVPSSPFYPRLREWYSAEHDSWLDRLLVTCMELRDQA